MRRRKARPTAPEPRAMAASLIRQYGLTRALKLAGDRDRAAISKTYWAEVVAALRQHTPTLDGGS